MIATLRTRPARLGWRQPLASAVLGAGVAVGQAPLGLWWVAVPALCALIWRVAATGSPRAAVLRAWCGGAGYFAAAMFWIVEPFLVDPVRHGWMAPFALLFLAFGLALFWALAALAARATTMRRRALRFAVALAGVELLRGYALTGLPWALIGHIWIGTPVMQAASVAGPVGLTLLTTLAAAAPLLFGRTGAALAAAVLAGIAGWGALRLAAPDPLPPRAVQLRLVQPNAPQDQKWRADMAEVFFARQLAFTAAPAVVPPDLVIWPESAIPWLLEYADIALAQTARAAGGTPVALGINRRAGNRLYNSLIVTGPDGTVTASYDKSHLVPFGEYMPFGDLAARMGMAGMAARDGDGFSAGSGAVVLDLGPVGKMLPLICYEAIFPQALRAAPERADWVLQITNDAWFGNLSGPYQHLAQARLRAVEQGLPVIRVANTGVSAVIDAKGRVLARLPLNTDGYLDAPLPAPLSPTPYARWGDGPALLLILAVGLGSTIKSRRFRSLTA